MTEVDLSKHTKALLLKISVITGWQLSEHEVVLNILYDQLSKKLNEDYGCMNLDEIEYALRSLGTTVEDWGKTINLNLIDKVLIPYKQKRAIVRQMEGHAVVKRQQTVADHNDWKEVCEIHYQKYLGRKLEIDLLPYQCYDEVVKCQWVDAKVYEDFIPAAISKLRSEEVDSQKTNNVSKSSLSKQVKNTVESPATHDQNQKVIQIAKRLAVLKLYARAEEIGYKNLFQKSN